MVPVIALSLLHSIQKDLRLIMTLTSCITKRLEASKDYS